MALPDDALMQMARAGFESAEEMFWEFGQSPNIVLMVNDQGAFTTVEYADRSSRDRVAVTAILHRATAAVLAGESFFRKVMKEEDRPPGSLADDPLAGEQVFALGVMLGDPRGLLIRKEIFRDDDGAVRLGDLEEEWQDALVDSWLRDALDEVNGPRSREIRESYDQWSRERAADLVRRTWGGN